MMIENIPLSLHFEGQEQSLVLRSTVSKLSLSLCAISRPRVVVRGVALTVGTVRVRVGRGGRGGRRVFGRRHDGGARGGHLAVVDADARKADQPHHVVDLVLRVGDARKSRLKQLSRPPQLCQLLVV